MLFFLFLRKILSGVDGTDWCVLQDENNKASEVAMLFEWLNESVRVCHKNKHKHIVS